MKIVPKNWREFQHYKDRNPPWIRLHRKLLDDKDFHRLPVASRALAPMLWLLASESMDGQIDADVDNLAFRLRQTEREIEAALKPLIDKGFFVVVQDASSVLADCVQLAVPETETETEQRQIAPSAPAVRFERFWSAYPRKVGKDAARKAFDKRKPDDGLLDSMLSAIDSQKRGEAWRKDGGQFIPHPSTWLNEGRWQDEGVCVAPENAGESVEDYRSRMAREREESRKGTTAPPAEIRELASKLRIAR